MAVKKTKKDIEFENNMIEMNNRLLKIEGRIGTNEDGTPNGNGFISKIEKMESNIKSNENYCDNISEDLVNISHNLEKMESNLENNMNDVNIKLDKNNNDINIRIDKIDADQNRIIDDIKLIKEKLNDTITSAKLEKYLKNLITIAAAVGALGTILSALYFVSSKFMS